MEKEDRKNKLEEFKQQERQKLISILPMSKESLREYFNFLDQNSSDEDDDSFEATKKFCENNRLDFMKVKEWAEELGGYNDVEVLWNVEQNYEFLLGDSYQE